MGVGVLTQALADRLEVPSERLAFGPGSVGVLGQLIAATCDAGDEVVFAWRSFEAYPILVTLAGAVPVMVPLGAGDRHDLEAMADAVTERVPGWCSSARRTTRRARPSPTASSSSSSNGCPATCLVVLDEAYLEFVTAPDSPDALAVHRSRPNVVVLRTFSKAYGLAGLRVGYAVAHEPVAEALRKTAIPFGVNALAQVAAVASLTASDELEVRVKELVAERERVLEALAEQGWELSDSQANFVWFGLGGDGGVRGGLSGCRADRPPIGADGARATIAEREANDRLIEVAGAFLAASHP